MVWFAGLSRHSVYNVVFSQGHQFPVVIDIFLHTFYIRAPFFPPIVAYERQQSCYEPRDIYRSYLLTAELSAYHLVPPLDFNDTPRLRTSRTAVHFSRTD